MTLDVFISYRRQDAAGYALAMRRELTREVPQVQVFLDVEDIDAGTRWRDVIRERVQRCDVMLVLIGDEWLVTRDGRRKIDLPDDPVRFELTTAMARPDVVVLPVLVEEARMPAASELPDDVAGLCEFGAHEVHDRTYDQDLFALLERLRGLSNARESTRKDNGLAKPAGPVTSTGTLQDPVRDYPVKITEKWLREQVPGMGREQLLSLITELFRRGWKPGDVYDWAMTYSPLQPTQALPGRITTLWLATNVPLLSPARVKRLVEELRGRGWSEHDVRVHVYGNRLAGLAPGLPSTIRTSYLERFAELMDLDEQDRLAAALVERGWDGAGIRQYVPYAHVPAS